MTTTDECPAGCGRRVLPEYLLCGPCWREVPPSIQGRVWRSWRDYQADRNPSTRAAYTAARDDALAAIR